MDLSCHRSTPTRTVGVLLCIVVALCISFEFTDGASSCFSCQSAPMYCNDDFTICHSRCQTKMACADENHVCLIATSSPSNNSIGSAQLFAVQSCFPRYTEEGLTPHYCGLYDPAAGSGKEFTCSCTYDNCNGAIYLQGATVPKPSSSVKGPEGTLRPDSSIVVQETPRVDSSNITPKDLDESDEDGNKSVILRVVTICVPSMVSLVLVVVVGCYVYRYWQKLKQDRKMPPPTSNTESTSLDLTTEDSDVKVIGQDTPPESPVHVRGNHLHITLSTVIGRGRFGAVWRAELKNSNDHRAENETAVAVKVFHEMDSASWSVEKEMFTDETVMLKHENVVEFIAAEVRQGNGYGSGRQFWLVTRYYSNGSLYQYLKHHTVSWQELCRLSCTTARGVAHLHSDVYGPHGLHKVPVAHRDLKSSNVLVKDDGTCVIADFGLCIQLDPRLSIDQLASNGQAGTPRYMAPEALESKVNLHDIESFKQMDVYSLGLIVWEIAKRCNVGHVVSAASEHQLPFHDTVRGRASIEDIKTVVVIQGERPAIPASWRENTGMHLLTETIEDCWDSDPEARLTARCVEARFTELISWAEGEQHLGDNELHTITVM